MEDFGLLLMLIFAFCWIFEDEIFNHKKHDKKGTSEVHETEPDETKSGKPQKKER